MVERNFKLARIGITNVCLIPATEGYLLVDTSYENDLGALEKGLRRIGVEFSDIRYIVVTHCHSDHVGNLVQLRSNHTFKMIVHRKTAEGLETGGLGQPLLPLNKLSAFFLFMVKLAQGNNLPFPPLKISQDDIVFDDGGLDLQETAGVNARIVHTPGHTDDSVSIIFADNTAIVGDLCMSLIPIPGSQYVPLFLDDLEKVYASWKNLLDMGVKRIIPAHGKPFDSEKLVMLLEKRGA